MPRLCFPEGRGIRAVAWLPAVCIQGCNALKEKNTVARFNNAHSAISNFLEVNFRDIARRVVEL
jgi:hypothetical protein